MNLAELHYVGKMLMECASSGMQVLGGHYLSSTELMVAESLVVLGPATIGDIARRTGFVQSRISTVVANLHARGMVHVRTDERDRRRTIVEISERSLEEVGHVSTGDVGPALATWFPNASSEHLDRLVAALSGALSSLGASSGEGKVTGQPTPSTS